MRDRPPAGTRWIADLLRHGLLRGSFVPDRGQRELRELTRYRTSLIRERAAAANRLQKTLEGANIKLASVATNVLGASGRQMLAALIGGTSDAAVLADLAVGTLRRKLPELQQALAGKVRPHQRFLLAQQLAHIDYLDGAIAEVSAEIAERLRPFCGRPGAPGRRAGHCPHHRRGAHGRARPDLSRFPSASQLASWAGLCPGNHESAGKRASGRTRKGNPWLRAALFQAAHAAVRTKRSYFSAQYRRLAARRGAKRAIVAIAHSLLVVVYHLLTEHADFHDLGPDYFERRDRAAIQRQLVRRLERLGFEVAVTPKQPAA